MADRVDPADPLHLDLVDPDLADPAANPLDPAAPVGVVPAAVVPAGDMLANKPWAFNCRRSFTRHRNLTDHVEDSHYNYKICTNKSCSRVHLCNAVSLVSACRYRSVAGQWIRVLPMDQ